MSPAMPPVDGATMNGSDALATLIPAEFVDLLDARIARLLEDVERSDVWRAVTSPDSPPELVRETMKEIYLEITMYQPHVIEAAIATIGQMPRSMKAKMVAQMLKHQAEEFDHGEMALRDYVALGGDEAYARSCRPSPSAFAVAAVWWMIARVRDPFAYVGALYPFEGLTPIVTGRVKPLLMEKGMGADSLGFVEFHSTEDLKHTKLLRNLIERIVAEYPASRASILHGLKCFLHVYPIPGWDAAYRRAKARLETAVPT